MGIPIIGDIIDSVIGKAGSIVSEVVVDKDKRNEINANLERLRIEARDKAEQRLHEQMMGQIQTNTEEAKSESLFVAGWRPAIGWVGAVGIGYSFVAEPLLSWTARVAFKYGGTFPSLNYSELMVLVTGMLGFGVARTYEKVRGAAMLPPDDGSAPKALPKPVPPSLPEEAPWAK